MPPRFRFYGSFTDRAGDYQTAPVLAETVDDAERQLGLAAGRFARGLSIDPEWDAVLLNDGMIMSRAEWLAQQDGRQRAAE